MAVIRKKYAKDLLSNSYDDNRENDSPNNRFRIMGIY